MAVGYEWAVEQVALKDFSDHYEGDIVDVNHFTTFAEAKAYADNEEAWYRNDLVLIRNEYTPGQEGIDDRSWAYMENGRLPERFEYGGEETGNKVSQKFHKEVERYYAKVVKAACCL
jgi:hypothetical protein